MGKSRSYMRFETLTLIQQHSIQNAYIDVINNAQHYVYIENQFFSKSMMMMVAKYSQAAGAKHVFFSEQLLPLKTTATTF